MNAMVSDFAFDCCRDVHLPVRREFMGEKNSEGWARCRQKANCGSDAFLQRQGAEESMAGADIPKGTAESQMLAVSRIGTKCRVLGPGRRCVVWFHGCPRSCEGCIAKEMNEAPEEQRHAPEALAAMLAEAHPEGLTLSGGDPFYQPRGALGAFLRAFRKLCPACGVICYTGYRYEELLRDDDARVCLEFVDVLIDGPYVRELDDGMGLRGSANQRVLFLTGRYASERDRFVSGERRVQLEVTLDGAVLMSGVPGPGFIDGLQRELRNRSAELRF